MGLVNTVVPLARARGGDRQLGPRDAGQVAAGAALAQGARSTPTPTAPAGLQQLAGDATLLYYMSEEAQEGRNAFMEKRAPDFGQFPRRP